MVNLVINASISEKKINIYVSNDVWCLYERVRVHLKWLKRKKTMNSNVKLTLAYSWWWWWTKMDQIVFFSNNLDTVVLVLEQLINFYIIHKNIQTRVKWNDYLVKKKMKSFIHSFTLWRWWSSVMGRLILKSHHITTISNQTNVSDSWSRYFFSSPLIWKNWFLILIKKIFFFHF